MSQWTLNSLGQEIKKTASQWAKGKCISPSHLIEYLFTGWVFRQAQST